MAASKLSIFIGSTKRDLGQARDTTIRAVLEAGHIPCGMELWAASFDPTLPTIGRYLEECDLHIILLGASYGSLADGKTGYVQWEYDKSIKDGRPVIALLLEKSEFENQVSKKKKAEKDKLKAFRSELQKHAICRYFKSEDDQSIAADCINSINEASKRLKPTAGWIRASSEQGLRLREFERNYFLRRLLDRVYKFSTLTKRLDSQPLAKRALGEAFWKVMLGRIKRHGYSNMFFESGSTLAYVADEFEKKIGETHDGTHWRITTNNAIILLQLLLHTHIDVSPRPAGAPEDYYGAMFNPILLRDPEAPPHSPRKLYERETEAIEETVATLQGDGRKRLYLSTASGLDFDHQEIHFRGPHVGSHPNMLFKRAIFKTGQPVVLFLTASKLEKRFELNRCYPVFDSELSWQRICQEHALALCVGYAAEGERSSRGIPEEKRRTRAILRKHLPSFDLNYEEISVDAGGAIITANAQFKALFED